MTPDELMARCKKLIDSIYGPRAGGNMGASYDEYVQEAESLCREMIAKGLEQAAVEAERRQGMILAPGQHVEFDSGFRWACYDLQFWCRQEAQRVKEGG